MADNRGVLLPVYIVADESFSMKSLERDLNDGLASLHESLRTEPMTAAKVRIAVLGFSDDVAVRMKLTDVRTERELPRVTIRGGTSYVAAFQDLLTRIPGDVANLKSEGYKVHRPTVFFLSDGQPTDGEGSWQIPHQQLVDKTRTPVAPNVIAFGLGQALAETILAVATRQDFAFMAVPGVNLGEAIRKFFETLTSSVVESGRAIANGDPEVVIERPDPDVVRMAIDFV
jgi:uncharacterized protein YegL